MEAFVMTSFRIDYNSITRELLPKGNYEAIIYEAEVRTFSSQNEGILISLVIRDDVEQTSQNMTLNDRLVLVDSALYKFQMVAKAVGLPDDEGWCPVKWCKLSATTSCRLFMQN
ncbi:DUF669 domain-containing protein [Alicyclobacillus acidoterrestris]|uniref:DUF669 domain-containing protein n=1 Tax=Alicyclobacillus acidoterrestris TaxID=1450 RepID=UPI003F53C541